MCQGRVSRNPCGSLKYESGTSCPWKRLLDSLYTHWRLWSSTHQNGSLSGFVKFGGQTVVAQLALVPSLLDFQLMCGGR